MAQAIQPRGVVSCCASSQEHQPHGTRSCQVSALIALHRDTFAHEAEKLCSCHLHSLPQGSKVLRSIAFPFVVDNCCKAFLFVLGIAAKHLSSPKALRI